MTQFVKVTPGDWVNPDHVTGLRAEQDFVVVFLRTGKRVFIASENPMIDIDQVAESLQCKPSS